MKNGNILYPLGVFFAALVARLGWECGGLVIGKLF